MITLNQTAGNDNALIWLIEIELEGTYYRYAIQPNLASISLSTGTESNVFSGTEILKGSFAILTETIPGESYGGIGSLGGFNFSLASFGTTDFNVFYPANTTHTTKMVGRLGFIWTGATLTSQITWVLTNCVCENYSSSTEGIYLEFQQANELQMKDLPPYKIQKDIDDKISYFPVADSEVYGAPLPLVYGDFDFFTPEYSLVLLAPALLVDKQRFTIQASYHKVDTTYYDIETKDAAFQWVNGAENYLEMQGDTSVTTNGLAGYYVSLLPSSRATGDYIVGKLYINRKLPGMNSDVNDVQYLIDDEDTTELTVNAGSQAAVRFDNSVNETEVGILGIASADVVLSVLWTTSVDGSNRGIELGFWNEVKPGGAGYSSTKVTETHNDADSYKITTLQIGNVSTDQSDSVLPWDLREVLGLDFYMKNVSGVYGGTTSGAIKIKTAYLKLDNIIVNNSLTKKTTMRGTLMRPTITGLGARVNIKLGRR